MQVGKRQEAPVLSYIEEHKDRQRVDVQGKARAYVWSYHRMQAGQWQEAPVLPYKEEQEALICRMGLGHQA
jgi:hypothetical protein